MKRLRFPAAFLALLAASALAQTGAHTPPANSAERRAIINAPRGREYVVYQVN